MITPGAQARPRIAVVLVMMGVVAAGLVVQLVRVQFGPYAPVFAARNEYTAKRLERIVPRRGLIYDRGGHLLAANASFYYAEIEVRQLTERSTQEIPGVLSKLLVLPFEDLHAQLARDWASEDQFRIRITRSQENERLPLTVDQTVADVINGFLADPEAPDLSGLSLVPAPRRVYPAGALAGHILGFVNLEGEGFFGIEGYYDDWLSGKSITVQRSLIPPEARLQPEPPAGVNLVLTIDLEIQQMVENVLAGAIKTSGSESGEIIVMHTSSGEILAMAAWPALDPGTYQPWLEDETGEEPVITPAVAAQYEPGSTFKVLTMAAALDAGVVSPDTEFIDTGVIEVGGHTITNWDRGAWGPQTMIGCMLNSLNVCLAHVASEKLGASLLYSYLTEFGLGQLTGVDLAGEVPGQFRTPRHPLWTESDIGTNSFGQGVSVTPVQLIAAIGSVANGGVMVQPHLVREVVGPQGVYWPKTTVLGRPIKPETAGTLTEMLRQSLEGETQYGRVAGYELAGKTGTAEIPTDFGYTTSGTVASFIGWGPLPNPEFIVLVRLDKPQTAPWGSVVAAPIFQEVVERLVVFLNIPPDDIRAAMSAEG